MSVWWSLAVVLIINTQLTDAADLKWLNTPDKEVKVFISNNVTLHWTYDDVAVTSSGGKLLFSQYTPGYSVQNLLLEANLIGSDVTGSGDDDVVGGGGSVDLVFEMYPSKTSLVKKGTDVWITLHNISIWDNASYMLDISFGPNNALHHSLAIEVFKEPVWKNTTKDYFSSENSHVTFTFSMVPSDQYPDIDHMTLTHTTFPGQIYELMSIKPHNGLWRTEYPSKDLKLETRITFLFNSKEGAMRISLWEIELSDRGLYSLNVFYEDGVAEVVINASLHIATDAAWKHTPTNQQYALKSHDLDLKYQAEVVTNQDEEYIEYTLSNIISLDNHVQILSLTIQPDGKTLISSSLHQDRVDIVYDAADGTVTLTFVKPNVNCTGSYIMKVFQSGNMILFHQFDIKVFDEEELVPDLLLDNVPLDLGLSDSIHTGLLVVRLPQAVPKADIAIYHVTSNNRTSIVTVSGVYYVEVLISDSLKGGNLSVQVDYHFHSVIITLIPAVEPETGNTLVAAAGIPISHDGAILSVVIITLMLVLIHIFLSICFYFQRKKQRCHHICHPEKPTSNHVEDNIVNRYLDREVKWTKSCLETDSGLDTDSGSRLLQGGSTSSADTADGCTPHPNRHGQKPLRSCLKPSQTRGTPGASDNRDLPDHPNRQSPITGYREQTGQERFKVPPY